MSNENTSNESMSQMSQMSQEKEKEKVSKVIEVVKETLPLPGEQKSVETYKLDAQSTPTYNKDTILYFLYLQYETNMITRQHLKTYFSIINAKHPEDIAKWLVGEAAKA